MKLRIKGNSIRMRLNREEVHRLGVDGQVTETVVFGAAPGERLTYALRASDDVGDLTATYRDGSVSVLMPRGWVGEWVATDRVGFETVRTAGGAAALRILVEKDFACLHAEDEDPMAYPHPASEA